MTAYLVILAGALAFYVIALVAYTIGWCKGYTEASETSDASWSRFIANRWLR